MKKLRVLFSSLFFIIFLNSMASANSYKIVVMPFDKLNKGKNEELETLKIGISETLSGALSTVDNFIIIDSNRVKRHLLENMQFNQTIGADDRADLQKLRSLTKDKLNGDYIIYGNFIKIGKQIQLTAKFMNVSSGKVLKAASVHGAYPNDIFTLQEKLARKLTDSISGAPSSNRQNSIKDYTNSTGNYTAYQYYIKGRIEQTQYDVKNYPIAISYYKKALKYDPKYALAWAGMAEVNALWGYQVKYAKGPWKKYLAKATLQGQKGVRYGKKLYQTYRALSMAYLNNSNFKMARKTIKNAYKLNKQDAETLQIMAQLENYGYKKMGEPGSTSYKHIQEALRINPELIIARWSLAHSYSTLGKKDDALREYKKILNVNPKHAPALHGVALIYYNKKNYTESEIYAVRTVEADRKTAQHHYTLGLARYKLKEYDSALKSFRNATIINPKYEKAMYMIATTYWYKKNYKLAYQYYGRVLKINPNHKNAKKWRADSLRKMNNKSGGNLKSSGDTEKHYNLALKYYRQRNWVKAEREAKNAIIQNRKSEKAIILLGQTYYNMKKYRKSIRELEKVLRINSRNDRAYNEIAIAWYQLKDYKKAEQYSKNAIKFNPQSSINHYNLGLAYFKQKEYDSAIISFRKAVDLNPQYTRAWYSLANCYWYQKNYNESYKYYGKVLEINPNHANAKKWRADSYSKMRK